MNEAEARAEHIDPALAGAVIELLDKQRTDLSAACLMQGRSPAINQWCRRQGSRMNGPNS